MVFFQPPGSRPWERSQEGGGTFQDGIPTLHHLVKQRGGWENLRQEWRTQFKMNKDKRGRSEMWHRYGWD